MLKAGWSYQWRVFVLCRGLTGVFQARYGLISSQKRRWSSQLLNKHIPDEESLLVSGHRAVFPASKRISVTTVWQLSHYMESPAVAFEQLSLQGDNLWYCSIINWLCASHLVCVWQSRTLTSWLTSTQTESILSQTCLTWTHENVLTVIVTDHLWKYMWLSQ